MPPSPAGNYVMSVISSKSPQMIVDRLAWRKCM